MKQKDSIANAIAPHTSEYVNISTNTLTQLSTLLTSLLCGLSFVFLGSAVLLFACVWNYPSRSPLVQRYNAAVNVWDKQVHDEFQQIHVGVLFSDDIEVVNFNLSNNVNDAIDGMVWLNPQNASDPINDEGNDIYNYDGLIYTRDIFFRRPAHSLAKARERYTFSLIIMETIPKSDLSVNRTFPIEIDLIHQQQVRSDVSRQTCNNHLYGAWREVDNTCLYHVQLQRTCIRIARIPDNETSNSKPSSSSNLIWSVVNNTLGPYQPIPPTNDTLSIEEQEYMQAQLERTMNSYGCVYDDVDENWRWHIGDYIPIMNPYEGVVDDAPSNALLNNGAKLYNRHISLFSTDGVGKTSKSSGQSASSKLNASEVNVNANLSSSSSTGGIGVDNGTFSSSSSSTGMISSSSSSSPPPVPISPGNVKVSVVVRHAADPYLKLQELTNNSKWFGPARQSLLLLSMLLVIAAVCMLIPCFLKECGIDVCKRMILPNVNSSNERSPRHRRLNKEMYSSLNDEPGPEEDDDLSTDTYSYNREMRTPTPVNILPLN